MQMCLHFRAIIALLGIHFLLASSAGGEGGSVPPSKSPPRSFGDLAKNAGYYRHGISRTIKLNQYETPGADSPFPTTVVSSAEATFFSASGKKNVVPKNMLERLAKTGPYALKRVLGRSCANSKLLYDANGAAIAVLYAVEGAENTIMAGPPFICDEEAWQFTTDKSAWLLIGSDEELNRWILRDAGK